MGLIAAGEADKEEQSKDGEDCSEDVCRIHCGVLKENKLVFCQFC